ncbi:septal ring lytic transglycosylase RlpA family protein [Endozoicomonadaceae bacterium StTr2]
MIEGSSWNISVRRTGMLAGVLSLALLAGCSGRKDSPFIDPHIKDRGPDNPGFDVSQVPDAVPRVHDGPIKNSPYELAGVDYKPLASAAGYSATGTASWYGAKFHGRRTANGEVYNMYQMTAAHKTLPLPSYVRVTNLENSRSVILRVNDRGPFHGDRLIDLSWVAAKKLDFHNKGTARVKVEGIDPLVFAQEQADVMPVTGVKKPGIAGQPELFLQLAALRSLDNAHQLRQKVHESLGISARVVTGKERPDPFYRVRIGPVDSPGELETLLEQLNRSGFAEPHMVYE